MTHVIQVRDLIQDLSRHRPESPVVFATEHSEFNFDRTRKTDIGVIEVTGFCTDAEVDKEEEFSRMEELEIHATDLLEKFDKLMKRTIANKAEIESRLAALIDLHEEVEIHLRNR